MSSSQFIVQKVLPAIQDVLSPEAVITEAGASVKGVEEFNSDTAVFQPLTAGQDLQADLVVKPTTPTFS
jgi:hypothetical protein